MKIQEAILSGKQFKRKGDLHDIWIIVKYFPELARDNARECHGFYEVETDGITMSFDCKAEPFTYEDILAEDWEIKQ